METISDRKIKILLADDHKMVCEGLRALINSQDHLEVIGEAQSGSEVVTLATELKPDLVIIDVSRPKLDGIEATKRILKKVPGTKIIAISMYLKKALVLEIVRAGVSGYVTKDYAFSELSKAIDAVMAGELYLCSKTTSLIVDCYIHDYDKFGNTSDSTLSERERHILKFLAEGKVSKEIANIIEMSPKTVDACRREIMAKLNVTSLAGLIKYAIRTGLTEI